MPYTPPSQLSPATSKQSTPVPSRSPSYVQYNDYPFPSSDARPALPRSAGSSSYLTKHRRSPSTPTGNEIPQVMSDMQRGVTFDPHGSLRQSPPPRTNGLIPSGMTISPPESTHNSDDEEIRGRSRELEKENLAELQAAIRGIRGERKTGSPVRTQATIQINGNRARSEGSSPTEDSRPPLSSSQRKISHSRSSTDSNIVFDNSVTRPYTQSQPTLSLQPSREDSDTDESDSTGSRPPMVRKKSGELVKPALRPHSRRRPSSMPGTPTYSKAVHFDSQLEHIRHFLQVDRPLAVSAGSSPVENYESETEFPFGSDEAGARSRGPSYEWEIRLANFPPETDERKAWPVYVERVFLSADKKNLIGTVVVQNLAFQKQVMARFTLDYWKTTSEVAAEYSNDVRRTIPDDRDCFTFSISLADQANLENKTLFFCVRYNVNGEEYWDSNNFINYQVDFMKKPKVKSPAQQPSGLGARPLNALPRSRPSPPTSAGRPKSMPISFDDFGTAFDNFGSAFGTSPNSLIGEPKIKLRSPRSKSELIPDAPVTRRNKSSAPMFGHRYDFASSLSAAKNSAYAVLGDESGLPATDTKQSSREVPVVVAKSAPQVPAKLPNGAINGPVSSAPAVTAPSVTTKPAALFSEKPPLTSQSYQELVDKYCFFGNSRSSPTMDKTLVAPKTDRAVDEQSVSDVSLNSAQSSGASTPVQTELLASPPSELSSVKAMTPTFSRSSSPMPLVGSCMDSRSNSPASFGYRYHQSSSQTLLAEAPQATVILG